MMRGIHARDWNNPLDICIPWKNPAHHAWHSCYTKSSLFLLTGSDHNAYRDRAGKYFQITSLSWVALELPFLTFSFRIGFLAHQNLCYKYGWGPGQILRNMRGIYASVLDVASKAAGREVPTRPNGTWKASTSIFKITIFKVKLKIWTWT